MRCLLLGSGEQGEVSDELLKEGNSFEPHVVTGVEHTDNKEREERPHTGRTARRCAQTNVRTKRSGCGFSRVRRNWYSSSPADHKPAPRIPLDKVLFRLRERGRSLYQLEFPLLQFIHGQGQLLWVGVCL